LILKTVFHSFLIVVATWGSVAGVGATGGATAFQFGDFGLEWRGRTATARQVTSARSSLGLAFGSCSFQEPLDGLRALGLL